jgi:hypothetical protein
VTGAATERKPDVPSRKRLLLRTAIGPLLAGGVAGLLGFLAGGVVMLAGGKGIGHAGGAAAFFLVIWLAGTAAAAALGLAAFLVVATAIRLVRFALGRRPWPWSGTVHGGALATLALFALAGRSCGHALVPTSAVAAPGSPGEAQLVSFLIQLAFLVAGLPALVVGGVVAGLLHRPRG